MLFPSDTKFYNSIKTCTNQTVFLLRNFIFIERLSEMMVFFIYTQKMR